MLCIMEKHMHSRKHALGILYVAFYACGAFAQLSLDYEDDFVVIGDPGNRDTTLEETAWFGVNGRHMGGVDYEYRLARLELTVEQHFEFVVAYLPFYGKLTGNRIGGSGFVGANIYSINGVAHIRGGVSPARPSDMSWEYLARYVNWLHHGKVVELWAFETGVYDTSTFTQNDDGTWNHQSKHFPRARYWIPTLDEWTKAAYWDPKKDNGAGGYWKFQNSSDDEPIPGLFPEDGGERNAGDDPFPLDVGSYPNVKSPWGLLDMAGGEWEYTETPTRPGRLHRRWVRGTRYDEDQFGEEITFDKLGIVNSTTFFVTAGMRLASSAFHPADMNQDGYVDYFDMSIFITLYAAGDTRADLKLDGIFDINDVRVFLGLSLGI